MRALLAALWNRALRVPAIQLVYRTVREVQHDDATHMAAGVAYYALLSLFPLVTGTLTLLSVLLPPETIEQEFLDFTQTYIPGLGEVLTEGSVSAPTAQGALGAISLAGLFWTATAVFGAVSRSLNRAWDIHEDRPFYIDKPRHLLMALGVGALFMLSVAMTTALRLADNYAAEGDFALEWLQRDAVNTTGVVFPFFVSLAIFLLLYKFVPNTVTRWRYIWPGALLASLAFEVSKGVFIVYLDRYASYDEVYGSIGSLVALMVWIYICALTLIVGAEFTSEYERMRRGIPQGQHIPPQ